MKAIEIIGGGLAGLALGRALAHACVPVSLHEAQAYPRHRVCGEFISGLRPDVMAGLDLSPVLADARQHRSMAWHWQQRRMRVDTLPTAALALSRHALDQRLAEAFVAAGGDLHVGSRVAARETREGRVWATGRRAATRSEWLGLKVHCVGLSLAADLEFHLAPGAYVGVTAVEGSEINVCGLFRRRPEVHVPGASILPAYLRACGLATLADRVESTIQPGTQAAVAALNFDRVAPADRIVLGDAFAMIPPYTGDGMAMAFESAWLALDPLLDYARGQRGWADTENLVRRRLRARFGRRLRLAGTLQRVMVSRQGQAGFAALAGRGLLPFGLLFRLLH